MQNKLFRSSSPQKPIILAVVALLINSCGLTPTQNRYQLVPGSSTAKNDAVTELQNKAISALDRQNAQLSIEYLERAIKIEPRDAMSWHYLAQSYYLQRDTDKCLAMIERSMSYGSDIEDVSKANQTLKRKCQAD